MQSVTDGAVEPAAMYVLPRDVAHCLFACCPSLVACCLLPAACCPLPFAGCPLPSACCLLLPAFCLLPNTYCSLLAECICPNHPTSPHPASPPPPPCAGIEAVVQVMQTWQKHEGVQCNCCLALMALVRGTGSICQVTLMLAHSPVGCTVRDSGMGDVAGVGGGGRFGLKRPGP